MKAQVTAGEPGVVFRSAISLAIVLAAGSAGADGEDGAVHLDKVVVSATRTPTPAEVAPAAVTVIGRKEMERLNVRTVDEVLRFEAGVEIKRSKGIADATPRVQMRGLYGQDRTLVLVDGLPVNDAYAGAVPLSQLAIGSIERIEIIRGPASALYGGNAMGGVINIVTRRPTTPEASARVGYGSDATRRVFASVSGRLRPSFGLRVGIEQEGTRGYANVPVSRPVADGPGTLTGGYATTSTAGKAQWVVGDKGDNAAGRENVNLQADWEPAKTSRFKLDLQLGRQSYGYGRPHTYLTDANGAPAFSGEVAVGDSQKATVSPSSFVYYTGLGSEIFATGALTWEQGIGALLLSTKLGYQRTAKWYTTSSGTGTEDYDTAPGSLSDSTSDSWVGDIQATYSVGEKHVLTGGFTSRLNGFDQASFGLTQYRDRTSKTDKTDTTRGRDRFHALYLQEEWRPWTPLAVYLGARLDYWKADNGRAGNVGSEVDLAAHSDFAVSPRLSFVVTPAKETTVRISGSRAFRPPSIYELYRTWQSGTMLYHSNPELEPETLWNAELAAEQRLFGGRARIGASVYYSRLIDGIESYIIESERFLDNVSSASIKGVESEVEVRPLAGVRVWGNLTVLDTEVLSNPRNPDSQGKHLANVAGTLANIGGEYTYRWFRVATSVNYRGRIYTSERNDDVPDVYGGYTRRWLWNGKAAVTPSKHVEIAFFVENILDRSYFDYYIGRGRWYFVEILGKL